MEEKKDKIININVVEVIRLLLTDKKKVCIYSCVAGVIGVLLAFGTPKIYKSTVILAPEESGNSFSGSISSLASMVGMNMKIGQTGDALYPEIYPDLMGSTGFIVGLFPVKVTNSKTNETYSYMEYIQEHQKLAIADYPKALIVLIIEKLSEDDTPGKNHKINPRHLTKKDYRTKKARVDLEYMQKLFEEAKQQYTKARQIYASYCDANSKIALQSVQSKIDDLENEMQLKYNIYQQVVEQLQLAKAKVQERTPAFTIVQEATVPIKHSSRPKIVTLIIWMFLGFMLRSFMLFWRNREKFINI